MLRDYFALSVKNLRHRGIRSWLTLLGIFIGIAAVVSLITLGNGLQAAVSAQFGASSTEVITVQAGGLNAYGPPGSGVVNPLTINDAWEIEKLSSVDLAIPVNIETLKAEFNNHLIIGRGFDLQDKEKKDYYYESQQLEAEVGRLLKDEDFNRILIGYNFLDKDKNGFDKAIKVGDKLLIQDKKFEVIGILKKKGSFIIDNALIFNHEELDKLVNLGDKVDVIQVKVKDKNLIDKTKEDIEKLLRKRRGVKKGEEDFEVSTPQAMMKTINTVLGGVQAFIVMIASISIIVGGIGIVNTMTTSVLERKKEIGIMKAIGATNKDIFMQFFIESGLMGLVGGVVGIIAGLLIGWAGTSGINNFIGGDIGISINFSLIIYVLIGSFLIGSIAGIAPAMQAAKQNPVEALRG